jgi:hypothetical protein
MRISLQTYDENQIQRGNLIIDNNALEQLLKHTLRINKQNHYSSHCNFILIIIPREQVQLI